MNQLQTLISKILPVTSTQQSPSEEAVEAVEGKAHTEETSSSPTPNEVLVSAILKKIQNIYIYIFLSTNPYLISYPTLSYLQVIAHKILQALEDLTEVSTTPPVGIDTFYRCSSCQGCQGRLLSL